MTSRSAYPSDISDARWARIDRRPTGIPAPTDLRAIFNAILYVNRTGIAWKYLPHDFPPHATVYSYYAALRDEGIFARPGYELTGLARVKEGRSPGADRSHHRHPEHQDLHQRPRDQPGNRCRQLCRADRYAGWSTRIGVVPGGWGHLSGIISGCSG
jgi:transposase